MNWRGREECHCPSNIWVEKSFDVGEVRKKYLIRCQISRSKTRYAMFQHQLLFNLVKDLVKRIDGLGRSVIVRAKSESETTLNQGSIRKKALDE